jgi:hypothetical protein
LTPGHARSLLVIKDPEAVARRVVEEGLTVRDVERIAHAEHGNGPAPKAGAPKPGKDPDTRALEKALEDVLASWSRSSIRARAATFASATSPRATRRALPQAPRLGER